MCLYPRSQDGLAVQRHLHRVHLVHVHRRHEHRHGRRQPKAYPHPRIPAARLLFVIRCFCQCFLPPREILTIMYYNHKLYYNVL